MGITTALEWQFEGARIQALVHHIPSLANAFDCRKIVRNIDTMVSDLSKLELQMRRSSSHSPRLVNAKLEEINTTIEDLEQWITMLLLIGEK